MFRKLIPVLLVLISGTLSAQPISEREKKEVFEKSKEVFSQHYHFKNYIKPTTDFLDKQWKERNYKIKI